MHENGGGNAIVRPGKRQQHILVINTIPASCRNPAPGHSRCSGQARASGLAGAERFKTHLRSTRTRSTASSSTEGTPSPASKSSWHHEEPRHPGTTDAALRHARAGLQVRNGPKPARGARATRPATSQHRVGRQRRGSDERRRTLVLQRASPIIIATLVLQLTQRLTPVSIDCRTDIIFSFIITVYSDCKN